MSVDPTLWIFMISFGVLCLKLKEIVGQAAGVDGRRLALDASHGRKSDEN
jgi:hypothetical protein